ncbi:peroxiredoxin family protein [Flagellimonas algicola]|uniref:TlpA family protein disulfide reductase n=1 Tax=Flagellimonas algicola TaxID=2583815 RepID=A0ABY2WPD5_9FLAO|nr:TlpA disulfide reductase family protein [Allomuricauda algicola]TMU56768.1 TlpA family protein disulfide reductase [Allomuricauda algicola]
MGKVGLVILSTFLLLLSCEGRETPLKLGDWWGAMDVSETESLPFNFSISKDDNGSYIMKMYNAEEVVVVDEFEMNDGVIRIQMPIFEGYIEGTYSENSIQGSFIKESLNRVVPFHAAYGKRDRFEVTKDPATDVSGVWETYFNFGQDNQYPGKGIFKQTGNKVTGTFRTHSGDYRYLEGAINGTTVKLSAFDGAHVFLFTAEVADSTMQGTFYSGNHFVSPFQGKRNDAFELIDADELTFLKEGYDRFEFSFEDVEGKLVSLSDERFRNKAVLVQIMGTWCPNCLDETRFYVDFLKNNPSLDIEFVALAFEYAKTKEKAFEGIARLRERVGVDYTILLAQYGTSSKQKANEKLPMLNHVISYPTTIYIDKQGNVKKIHTGFNGPATGEKYELFKKEFSETIQELTEEVEIAAK